VNIGLRATATYGVCRRKFSIKKKKRQGVEKVAALKKVAPIQGSV
jgi:hypothetical protein